MTKSEWANNLLASEHFKDVFDDLRSVEINKITSSGAGDIQTRENAYVMISAYNQIFSAIESMAADKKIVEKRWKIF